MKNPETTIPAKSARGPYDFSEKVSSGTVRSKTVRGGLHTLLNQGFKFVLQTASTAILARILSPGDYGLIAMVTSLTGIVALLYDGGLSIATIQQQEISHAQVSTLFWINCALGTAAAALLALASPAIAYLYHEPRLTAIALSLSLTFIFGALGSQHRALLRRNMRFAALNLTESSALLFGALVGIAMAMHGFGYWSLVAQTLSVGLMTCALTWRVSGWIPGRFSRNVGARSMVNFGANIAGFNVLNYLIRNSDNVLIGNVLGSAPLGLYSKAYGLLGLPISQINGPVTTVMLPALSRLQKDPKEYASVYLHALRALSLVTVPIVAFSCVFAQDIIRLLLGPQWDAAVPVFRLLTPAALAGAINIAPGWLCISLGQPRRQFAYGLVAAPLCITGFIIGVHWGIGGVAAAFSLIYTFLFTWFVWYASKGTPVKFKEIMAAFLSALFPSLAAGAITWSLRILLSNADSSRAMALAWATVFFIAYFAIAALYRSNRRILHEGTIPVRNVLTRFYRKYS